ncbi:hypothetical protein ACWCPH_27105, partial [Streptomyces zhihengii]
VPGEALDVDVGHVLDGLDAAGLHGADAGGGVGHGSRDRERDDAWGTGGVRDARDDGARDGLRDDDGLGARDGYRDEAARGSRDGRDDDGWGTGARDGEDRNAGGTGRTGEAADGGGGRRREDDDDTWGTWGEGRDESRTAHDSGGRRTAPWDETDDDTRDAGGRGRARDPRAPWDGDAE